MFTIESKPEVHHFSNDVYRKIEKYIRENSCDSEMSESITLDDDDVVQGIQITVLHYVSGEWCEGGSYDYGPKEMIWNVRKEEYVVDSFSYFNEDGDEVYLHDFSNERLEKLLNG